SQSSIYASSKLSIALKLSPLTSYIAPHLTPAVSHLYTTDAYIRFQNYSNLITLVNIRKNSYVNVRQL
ncbi:hypothetical protein QR676_08685, partial [Vibrio sp. TMPB1044]|uniref:hypothetical protein n=1 Tax=Vibrio sp. TMPB1044 TaxID=3051822 RepID=UPI00255B6D1A